ncbi:DUF4352 domain-containing protein [Kibdelosporangium lantanae]
MAACSSTPPPPPPPSATPTYEQPPRPVRPEEVPLKLPAVQDGDTQFLLIGLTANQSELAGSHVEFNPKGAYTRIRLVITNVGRGGTTFEPRKQQLVTTDGNTYPPDEQAMLIKRQPYETFTLGANDRLEFDLYYDIPKGAKAKALKAFGGATLTHDANDSTDVPLPR